MTADACHGQTKRDSQSDPDHPAVSGSDHQLYKIYTFFITFIQSVARLI
jgi:hypothetical protein